MTNWAKNSLSPALLMTPITWPLRSIQRHCYTSSTAGMDSNLQYSSYPRHPRSHGLVIWNTPTLSAFIKANRPKTSFQMCWQAGFSGSFKGWHDALIETWILRSVRWKRLWFLLRACWLRKAFTFTFQQWFRSSNDASRCAEPFSKIDASKLDMIEVPSGSNPLLDKWMPQSQFHGASIELTSYDYSQTKLVVVKRRNPAIQSLTTPN